MFTFFRCVAESVAERGLVSLVREIPFGTTLIELASDVWRRVRERKALAEMRVEVQDMAQAASDQVREAAAEAARAAYPTDSEKSIELELYLTQVPATIRQTLRRPEDPTGTTVPLTLAFDKPEDLLPLLPTRVSQFRPGAPLPGREGWTLTDLLGTGGFGEVWLAAHPTFPSLKRAVKFCLELTAADRTLLHEGELIDRVMRAGPVPNVVPLIDANLTGQTPWLMYEYVPGGDLVALASEWRSLPPPERHSRAIAGLRQITSAVAHFHKLGVVHRDLKPANVLVSGEGSSSQLKVADFGIGGVAAAKELELDLRMVSTGTRMATAMRGAFTPIYASPQQKRGTAPDPRDDVFALGIIGYQLLVGDVTAERPGGKRWRRELESQGVEPELLDVLESCWDDAADERPKDASELLTEIDRVAASAPPPVPTTRPAPPPLPPRSPIETPISLNEAEELPFAEPTRSAPNATPKPEPLPVPRARATPMGVIGVVVVLLLASGGGLAALFLFKDRGDTKSTAPSGGIVADGGNDPGFVPQWLMGDWHPYSEKMGMDYTETYRFGSDGSIEERHKGELYRRGTFRRSGDYLTFSWEGGQTNQYAISYEPKLDLLIFYRVTEGKPTPAFQLKRDGGGPE